MPPDQERQYHHTISASLIYALHAALHLLHEEGLEERWRRHRHNYRAFRAGVEVIGLKYLPDDSQSLWALNAVRLPEGLDEGAIRRALLEGHGIEVGEHKKVGRIKRLTALLSLLCTPVRICCCSLLIRYCCLWACNGMLC